MCEYYICLLSIPALGCKPHKDRTFAVFDAILQDLKAIWYSVAIQ